MSLIGTYNNKSLNATLEIKEANNANGEGSGTFTIGGASYAVNLHYHFDNNVGQPTVLQIWASDIYGYDYLGAAGSTPTTDGSDGISLAGGLSNVNATQGFSGLFTK